MTVTGGPCSLCKMADYGLDMYPCSFTSQLQLLVTTLEQPHSQVTPPWNSLIPRSHHLGTASIPGHATLEQPHSQAPPIAVLKAINGEGGGGTLPPSKNSIFNSNIQRFAGCFMNAITYKALLHGLSKESISCLADL